MQTEDIKITCSDGLEIAGTLFTPDTPKAAVMIGPATGIKRRFYFAFAEYLATHRFATITFDNRGIGDSLPNPINQNNESLENWGRLDMTAVLEFLKSEFPDLTYHLIGHSAGGQLLGLMENAGDIHSMVNFASSSGSLQYAKYPFRFQSSFYLNIFIPLSNLFFGKTNSQWVGMGEPLPKRVASDWRRWCNSTGYVQVDLGKSIKEHHYNEIRINSLWIQATDDQIANLATVKDMIRVYKHLNSEILTISPSDYGFKEIGHMSFFSKKKSALWTLMLDWLNKQLLPI